MAERTTPRGRRRAGQVEDPAVRPEQSAIEKARSEFLRAGTSRARRAGGKPQPVATVARREPPAAAPATPARRPDIAERSAGGGQAFVEAMTAPTKERGYRSWAELDVEEIRGLTDPEARAGAISHLASNARDPAYAEALRGVDPDLAKKVAETAAAGDLRDSQVDGAQAMGGGGQATAQAAVVDPVPDTALVEAPTAATREPTIGQNRIEPVMTRDAGDRGQPGDDAPIVQSDGYEIPAALLSRYVVQNGKYWKFDGADKTPDMQGEPHFEDKGSRLSTPSDDRKTIADMITVAQAKGWNEITLNGSDEFRRNAWIEATLAGIDAKGFKPDERDQAMLEAARRERDTLNISAGERSPRRDAAEAVMPTANVIVAREAPVVPAPERTAKQAPEPQPPSAPTGEKTLVAHGSAPYLYDQSNKDSYYVTYKDELRAEKTVWGVDLQRAMSESGAKVGDVVALENLGKEWVTVDADVKDASGKVVGHEPKEVQRNTWEVRVETPMRELRAQFEQATSNLPENVRREVMNRFAERAAAGMQAERAHERAGGTRESLGAVLDTRLAKVDQERVARNAPPTAPEPKSPGRGRGVSDKDVPGLGR